MSDQPDSPRPMGSTPIKNKGHTNPNNILIDSDTTPKSIARRFQSPAAAPVNQRKNLRSQKARNAANMDDSLDSTDEEYFAEPVDPNELKKILKNKKKNTPKVSALNKSKSETANPAKGKSSGSIPSVTASCSTSIQSGTKSNDTSTFNMISRLLNEQTERLESQINESKDTVLNTMESKMDNILKESERRITSKLIAFEERTEEKFVAVGARLTILETGEHSPNSFNDRIAAFTKTINDQMDQITSRLDDNLRLIRENSARFNTIGPGNGVCPNEDRMNRCEGSIDNIGQENKNFSLIISGLRPEYQNANGIVSFARDLLKVFMDQNEIADIIKMGLNRQGYTVTKVVFYSVGSRLRLYQARTQLRGNRASVFVNEDLTKLREKLNYMARILFKGKQIAKNWTFLGRVYIKKTTESNVVEITKKEDLAPYDTEGTLAAMGLM